MKPLIATLLLAVAAGGALAQSKPFPEDWYIDGASMVRAMEGKPAIELSVASWIGRPVALREQRGKVVVIDFWASWCPPCLQALPLDRDIVRKFAGKDLVFLGVHDGTRAVENAEAIAKDKQVNYPVAIDKADDTSTAAKYKLHFWPTYVAIDKAGVIRAIGLKPEHVDDAVERLLAEPASGRAPEFAPEVYAGGAMRPTFLEAIEGKPAPAIRGDRWLGSPVDPASLKGGITVVHFFNPTYIASMKGLQSLAKLQGDLAPKGVTLVGVCDARAAWDSFQSDNKNLGISVVQDAPSQDPGRTRGVTHGEYGVTLFPTTVIIDRAGITRAAGVRVDKVKEVVEKLLSEPGPSSGAAPPAAATTK